MVSELTTLEHAELEIAYGPIEAEDKLLRLSCGELFGFIIRNAGSDFAEARTTFVESSYPMGWTVRGKQMFFGNSSPEEQEEYIRERSQTIGRPIYVQETNGNWHIDGYCDTPVLTFHFTERGVALGSILATQAEVTDVSDEDACALRTSKIANPDLYQDTYYSGELNPGDALVMVIQGKRVAAHSVEPLEVPRFSTSNDFELDAEVLSSFVSGLPTFEAA